MKVEQSLLAKTQADQGDCRSGGVKRGLKRVRASQPFNRIATSSVRGFLRATGLHSESVITHLHRVGAVRSELPNGRTLRLWSRADDWVSNQVYWRGWKGYEPETAPLFFRLTTGARITIDVGAYVGFFTLLAAHANHNGRVFAFEPLRDANERLRSNVSLNELSNVLTIDSAVSDIDGSAEFFSTATPMPCSSSLSYDFMRFTESLCSLQVPVVKLDTFVRENQLSNVDLVKIDTESTEPRVLRGMIETIRRDQPLIICEVLKGRGSEESVQEIVREIHYHAYLLTPSGPVLQDKIEAHPVWLNYLFTALGPSQVAHL